MFCRGTQPSQPARAGPSTLGRLRPPYHLERRESYTLQPDEPSDFGCLNPPSVFDGRFRHRTSDGSSVDQSNNELTDCSACVKRIALESNSPTDSTYSLFGRRSSGIAIVSVTATSLIGASLSRDRAGPESSACVAQI